ncbi:MAG: redoxin family protein [Hyphomonadaceae bacterium]|nr:redoxin family protein [Hyphomonadaceae bacterium]
MKRWIFALPLVALIGFGGLGLVQLFDGSKPSFDRPLRDAPDMAFAPLGGGAPINFSTLGEEEPILVNLWASWCVPCIVEHPLLVELSGQYPGRVHGLVFDDTEENAEDFLAARGNPFASIAMDPTGQGALAFGHLGVPETFVIAPGGVITFHHDGQLTREDLPALRAAMDAGPKSES